MTGLTATLIILFLFALRFLVPLVIIIGVGQLLNRLAGRWQLAGS